MRSDFRTSERRVPVAWRRGLAAALLLLAAASASAHDAGNIIYHEAGASALRRTNTVGTFSAVLTHPPAGYTDESASWSPTGRSVVFERRAGSRDEAYDGQDRQIVVVDRLGRRERVIATGFRPAWSGWSPNRIAFVGWPFMDIPELQCLYTINADGTDLQRLSCVEALGPTMPWCTEFYTCYHQYQDLAWSRDGRHVIAHVGTLVVNYQNPSDRFWMYTMWRTRTTTREQSRVPGSPDAIAPIAFSMSASPTLYYGQSDRPAIFQLNYLTGAKVQVAEGFLPSASPDATKFAFVRSKGADLHARLYVANADGSAQTPLAGPTAGVSVAPLDWSGDSSHILLQRSQPGRQSLHRVTTTGQWGTVRWNGLAEPGAWYTPAP